MKIIADNSKIFFNFLEEKTPPSTNPTPNKITESSGRLKITKRDKTIP